ncbi:choice-of-anchor I family protein, partial [Polymorphobacter multimanifer]|uniref:choice-of-anchor I family protein n=1 Tax=Polymorphobacter multimanifer TaxID=1070431 RepID=UPI00357147AF
MTTLTGNANTLTIASYNVLNLDPGDPAARFTNLALDIVGGLGSPDIIALQEIQDNSGPSNNGVVSASMTLQMLADAINANGGPTYTFIDNPFITNNTNGGEPGGNIRVAYLYNAARVSLVEGSLATTPDAAIDFAGSRPPLIATFDFEGEQVTLINNHFTSKGGSSPLFGAVQPSGNGGAADRLVQAQNVADYVATLDPGAKVIVLGDLNEFANEESLAPLTAAGLGNLSLTLPANERYSYSFDGNAQQLDQVFVSGALDGIAAMDIVHLNSEYVATSTSAADHDPIVIALTFAPPVPFGQPGDIAFVGFNADGNDDLAFVALKAIAAGQVIYFNDQEWQGTAFNTGEGQVTWTASANIAAGTVVTINSFSNAPVSNLGTTSGSSGLGSDGEIVYAYVGAPFAPTSFLAAIANDGFAVSGGTLDGTGLVVGETAIDLSNGGTNPGEDIGVFNGERFGATSFADYLSIINNPANWLTQDGAGDQSNDGIGPDLPFETTAFILGGVETHSVGFQPNAVAQAEGDSGTTAFTFTVARTGGTTGVLDFSGTVMLGSADADDFGGIAPTGFSGQIAAGATSATVTINVSGDTVIEADEDFTLTLTRVTNGSGIAASIGTATATGTITNDDAPAADFAPGDLAFVGFNSDGADNLALVALKAIDAGTVLYFSDNEWNGTAWTDLNESSFALTLTSSVAAGGIIKLDNISTAASTTSNVGTVASVAGGGGNRGLANANEQVYVYVADAAAPLAPTAFLTAVSNDGFAGALLAGTGLVAGQTALDLATVDAGADIAAFTGARNTAASFADYLPILNNAANWATQDAAGDQSADGIAPDVPFSNEAFTTAGPGLSIGGIDVYDAASSLAGSVTTPVATDDLVLVRLGSIQGGVAGAESIAFANGRVYATSGNGDAINIHSVTAQGTLVNEAPILLGGLPSYAPSGVTSVDVSNGIIAVGYANIDPEAAGFVALFNAADNSLIKTIQVGVLPDDVTFSPDGAKLLVANEGEPLSAQGSISIIDMSGGAANAAVSNTISFASLNGMEAALRARGVAIAPGQPAAGDIEPEYITISADGTRAYVTLQEVNAVAVIDLTNPAADRPLAIQPLGTIDRNLPGNALDTSDRDGGINLRNVDIQSLPQPDAIATFDVGGVSYFITANEGDSRVNVPDSVRLSSSSYVLDPILFPNAAAIKADADLGRLNVLTTIGDTDGDGDFDVIHTLGGRGVSIFRQEADGSITKVRETGGEFEAIIAATNPAIFNSNQSTNPSSLDTRSDDKGPEPEGVSIGVINGRTYAFVGLERVGGYMVYDVTDPANATFVTYKPQTADDLGPETSV